MHPYSERLCMLQFETVIRAEQTAGLTPLPLLSSFGGVACPFPFISSMTLFCKICKSHEVSAPAHVCHSK